MYLVAQKIVFPLLNKKQSPQCQMGYTLWKCLMLLWNMKSSFNEKEQNKEKVAYCHGSALKERAFFFHWKILKYLFALK